MKQVELLTLTQKIESVFRSRNEKIQYIWTKNTSLHPSETNACFDCQDKFQTLKTLNCEKSAEKPLPYQHAVEESHEEQIMLVVEDSLFI